MPDVDHRGAAPAADNRVGPDLSEYESAAFAGALRSARSWFGAPRLDSTMGAWLPFLTLGLAATIGSVVGAVMLGGWYALGLGLLVVAHHALWLAHVSLAILGIGGGMFGLPLQTYVQLKPPSGEKGRVVSATSFVNWIFIFGSAAFYGLTSATLPINWIPGLLLLMVLGLLLYLPRRLARITAHTTQGNLI